MKIIQVRVLRRGFWSSFWASFKLSFRESFKQNQRTTGGLP